MLQSLKGKIVVITGAGNGIGRSIANALAKEGCKIVLCGGNNLDNMKQTAEMITEAGQNSVLLPGDLLDHGFRADCIKRAYDAFGGMDILINNAGLAMNEPLETTREEDLDRLLELNIKVPFMLCKQAIPYLRKSDSASIINMASVAAHKGYEGQSAYAASKHGLLGFTKSLAKELEPDGIRVHAISPGGVLTDMVKVARPDLEGAAMIMPEEIAELVVFLLSHRGNAIVDEIHVHRPGRTPFDL